MTGLPDRQKVIVYRAVLSAYLAKDDITGAAQVFRALLDVSPQTNVLRNVLNLPDHGLHNNMSKMLRHNVDLFTSPEELSMVFGFAYRIRDMLLVEALFRRLDNLTMDEPVDKIIDFYEQLILGQRSGAVVHQLVQRLEEKLSGKKLTREQQQRMEDLRSRQKNGRLEFKRR